MNVKFHMPLEHRKPQLYLYLVCLFSIWSDRTIELRVILWHQRRHRRQRSSTFSFSSIFSHSKANGILIADSWFEWIKFLFQFIRFRELSENQESNLKRKKISESKKSCCGLCGKRLNEIYVSHFNDFLWINWCQQFVYFWNIA